MIEVTIQQMALFIYIENFHENDIKTIWKGQEINPGFGGTTFQQLRLYEELKSCNIENLYLVCDKSENTIWNGNHLFGINDLHSIEDDLLKSSTLIINSGGMQRNLKALSLLVPRLNKAICWIHHPHDRNKVKLAMHLKLEIVSCGIYQYYSNRIIGGKHCYIHNYFYSESVIKKSQEDLSKIFQAEFKTMNNTIHIGYWGALVSSKGFHLVARYWQKITEICRKENMYCKLHVIGSDFYEGNLYRNTDIPTSDEYAKTIMENFSRLTIPQNIKFYGTVENPYSLAKHFDICFVNPSGIGEAASQTVIELFALGVPVITSNRYGMSDYINFTDFLCIKTHNDIPKVFKMFLRTKDLAQYKCSLILISKLYSSYKELSTIKWLTLSHRRKDQLLSFSPGTTFRIHISIIYTHYMLVFLDLRSNLLKPIKSYLNKLKVLAVSYLRS